MKLAFHQFVPACALVVGLLVPIAIAAVAGRPTVEEANARSQFEQLDARQQDRVRSYARRFLGSEAELQKLRGVHEVVTAEPELEAKLERLQQWLSKVDNATQNELFPSGEFAKGWTSLVEKKYQQQAMQIPEIQIPLESPDGMLVFKVTERQFYEFVDQIVREYGSLEEQSYLNSYEKSSAASLAKCVWISEGVLGGEQMNLSWMFRAIDFCYAEIMDSLADADDKKTIRKWEQMVGRGNSKIALVWKVILSGMKHLAHQLRDEYPAPSDDQLVKSFDSLTRDEQLAMIANPSPARQDLDLVAIREFGDESIKMLLQDYKILSANLAERSQGRTFFGGRGSKW